MMVGRSLIRQRHAIASQTAVLFQDNYTLINSILGKGKYAQVFAAIDKETNRTVAVKRFNNDNTIDPSVISSEIEALKAVDRHPNIVELLDFYPEENYVYLVLEHLKGRSLLDQLSFQRRFKLSQVRSISQQLISALFHCHSVGLIHRDIKAENIMYNSQNGRLHLVDFGLSIMATKGVSLCGTIGFISPEMAFGRPYDAKTDIWSAGMLLYILATGKMPYFHPHEPMMLKFIQSGAVSYPKDMDPTCKSFLQAMLAANPMERASASELLTHEWIA